MRYCTRCTKAFVVLTIEVPAEDKTVEPSASGSETATDSLSDIVGTTTLYKNGKGRMYRCGKTSSTTTVADNDTINDSPSEQADQLDLSDVLDLQRAITLTI